MFLPAPCECHQCPPPETAGASAVALRALRKATNLLGIAIGRRIAELRESDFSHNREGAKIEELGLRIRLLEEANAILSTRWEKIPERRRPHYTPELRYRILRSKDLLSLSQREAAEMFAVSVNTIARWEAEASAHPGAETVGSLVCPTPPVRRYADVVRGLIQAMGIVGFGGNDLIARVLARAGWKLSARTVGRVRREKPVDRPPENESRKARRVEARYPNHLWMADITEIHGLFRLFTWKLAVVFDAFSRMPLAWKAFSAEPSAAEIAVLVEGAGDQYGAPKHFVSDQGTQFTADEFCQTLAALGIRHRFGALGKHGSIAIIERFWRTLKAVSRVKVWKPLVRQDLEERLHLALRYYVHFRPHAALRGATPSEVYLGVQSAHLAAAHPPRGSPGEPVPFPAPQIAFLDAARTMPVLTREAA